MTRKITEQRKFGKGLAKIGGATLALSLILDCAFSAKPATSALRLTKHLDEARKAGALAEHSRIARDVHDTLAQCLTGIYTQLEAASQIRQKSPDLATRAFSRQKTFLTRVFRRFDA
ncbi:MAG TPA: histidine kinase dimerization/phosphoacceptor domain-containing protein [Chthoniobacterales bacterium]|nr:histidine kinase dimerization/phosphoacceptor domain-containing protein [Chthoniobacterales bacterium]